MIFLADEPTGLLAHLWDFVQDYPDPVLFGLLVLCGVGLPLPEEPILLMAGAVAVELSSGGKVEGFDVQLLRVAADCAAGILIGDLLTFRMGRVLGKRVLRIPFVRRIATRTRRVRAERFFQRYGPWAIFIARFFAGVRLVMYFSAGASRRISYWRFLMMDFLGTLVSVPISVWIGFVAYRELSDWRAAKTKLGHFHMILMAAAVAHHLAGGRAQEAERGPAARRVEEDRGLMPALPPRQQATRLWPVVGEREPEPFDPATWRLAVGGLVARPLALSFAELSAIPRAVRTGTLHCVTRWSRPESSFEGVPLEALLERAGPLPAARFVRFVSGRGHDTTLPLDACPGDVLVALAVDGGPVPPEHGGPVRTVLFRRYFYKSVKWLRTVELLAEDRPGFWERTSGYHNGADPWREERYAVADLDRREVERRMAAKDFSGGDWRGVELERRDLRGFSFRGAKVRDARFAGADLRGADFRGANLTNADLRGADLRGALLEGADLDGADLRGADLRDLRIPAAAMACTTFAGPGGAEPARVEGASLAGADASGLLDEQREFLRSRGVAGAS